MCIHILEEEAEISGFCSYFEVGLNLFKIEEEWSWIHQICGRCSGGVVHTDPPSRGSPLCPSSSTLGCIPCPAMAVGWKELLCPRCFPSPGNSLYAMPDWYRFSQDLPFYSFVITLKYHSSFRIPRGLVKDWWRASPFIFSICPASLISLASLLVLLHQVLPPKSPAHSLPSKRLFSVNTILKLQMGTRELCRFIRSVKEERQLYSYRGSGRQRKGNEKG